MSPPAWNAGLQTGTRVAPHRARRDSTPQRRHPLSLAQAPVPPSGPDDEKFLLCALDGDADYLVSEDSDLLDLKDAYARPSIVNCAEALAAL